jgi:hypothetical protein
MLIDLEIHCSFKGKDSDKIIAHKITFPLLVTIPFEKYLLDIFSSLELLNKQQKDLLCILIE